MTDLNIYITTFNCGRTLLDVDHFAANLFNGLKTDLPPDLVILSLQEIAPIGYSFLGGSFLTPYFQRFDAAIDVAAGKNFEGEIKYENILVRNVGMTALCMFTKRGVKERIRWNKTAGVGVGVWEMGNKGAVGCRIGFGDGDDDDAVLTFVAAHLAPMEDAWRQRNEDWKSICKGLVFQDDGIERRLRDGGSESEPLLASATDDSVNKEDGEEESLFSPISHIFFAGDLNYRTSDTSPKPDDYKDWPRPVESVSDVHHYAHLLKRDQLTRERSKNNTLNHLTEAEITFPPTYKYSSVAQLQAARAPTETRSIAEGEWLWAKHRVPSWCDRVLYLEAAPPEIHSYIALAVQPTSDHRPVVLSLSIPSQPLSEAAQSIRPPFSIRKDWKEARAAARRYELVVGLAAYLVLTWEGEAVLVGSLVGIVGGYLALRAMLGS